MNNRIVRDIEFGPDLGPLGPTPLPEPQGKINVVWFPSSPLDPGHWILDPGGNLVDVDEPTRPNGSGFGSGHTPGFRDGGGNPGGTIIKDFPTELIDPLRKETGKPSAWGKCINPSTGASEDCCNNSQKTLIQNAYKKILSLPCLSSAAFPTLLEDIKKAYKTIVTIVCLDDRVLCKYFDGQYTAVGAQLAICDHILATKDPARPDLVAAKLLHELIHAAGGNEVDAVAIIGQ